MQTVETSTWLALKARAESFVPDWAAFDPATQVSWPGRSFTKPQGGNPPTMLPYLRITHVPNVNRRLFLGSSDPHQRLGLLQVDVYGKKNEIAAVAVEIAGKVAEHFACGTDMWRDGLRVSVTKAPDVGQPIEGDTHVQVPVTIAYECFA